MHPCSVFIAFVLACALVLSAPARASDQPYEVEVWADATYDPAGQLTELSFPQKANYPPAFLENLLRRVSALQATPYLHEGQPATFETGISIKLTVTPGAGGGSVSVDDIQISPRVLRMTQARFPDDVSRSSDWSGLVVARCMVSVKGRCGAVDIVESNGLSPDSAREFAKASLVGWRFKPQRVNGKPIASEVIVPIRMKTEGVARPVLRDREY